MHKLLVIERILKLNKNEKIKECDEYLELILLFINDFIKIKENMTIK